MKRLHSSRPRISAPDLAGAAVEHLEKLATSALPIIDAALFKRSRLSASLAGLVWFALANSSRARLFRLGAAAREQG